MTEEFGFDVGINYKTADVAAELRKACPKGIDCYYDNVGGETLNIVMGQMALYGRICACGGIQSSVFYRFYVRKVNCVDSRCVATSP